MKGQHPGKRANSLKRTWPSMLCLFCSICQPFSVLSQTSNYQYVRLQVWWLVLFWNLRMLLEVVTGYTLEGGSIIDIASFPRQPLRVSIKRLQISRLFNMIILRYMFCTTLHNLPVVYYGGWLNWATFISYFPFSI